MPRTRRRKNKRKYKVRRIRHFNIKDATLKLKGLFSRVLLAAMVALFIFGLYHWGIDFFDDSSFFYVSKIELTMRPFLKDALSLDFYNISRHSNIFQLDIDNICQNTQKAHLEFKSVVISRKPPNVISVSIEYKEPVVFIKVSPRCKFFYGDQLVLYTLKGDCMLVPIAQDGVILPPDVATGKTLPIMAGIDFQVPQVKVGSVCSDKRLFFGIRFLMLVENYWSIKDHRIDILDLTDAKNISIFLENGIEVKLGEGNLKEKIVLLGDILEKSKFDLSKIECIDLRFGDIIVRPKQAQSAKQIK